MTNSPFITTIINEALNFGSKLSISKNALVCVLIVITPAICLGQSLPKALILTGNGNVPKAMEGYPPWVHEIHDDMITDILREVVVTEVTSDLDVLNDEALSEYDLLISYSMFLTPNEDQLDALYRFISDGKSLLTIHCGILSFMNWEKYEEIMGGIFIGGPSIEPESFNVSTTNMEFWGYEYSFRDYMEHPVSKVVNDFIIKDELYYFQPSKPDFFVIARANNHPVMWWHPVGNGKVMSLTLGHSREAKETDGFQQLLKNGVRWLLDYPLIESVRLRPLSTRSKMYPDYLQMPLITHADNKTNLDYATEGNENITLSCDKNGVIDLRHNGNAGTSTVAVMATNEIGLTTRKEFEITVIEDGGGNLASYYSNKASASSTEGKNVLFDVSNAIDGDPTTRWSSDFIDPSWIRLDLQKAYSVSRIVLHWEASYATHYTVQVSEEGTNWTTVADIKNSDGEIDEIKFDPLSARFIKVTGTKRSRELYGYSLFEVEVYQK